MSLKGRRRLGPWAFERRGSLSLLAGCVLDESPLRFRLPSEIAVLFSAPRHVSDPERKDEATAAPDASSEAAALDAIDGEDPSLAAPSLEPLQRLADNCVALDLTTLEMVFVAVLRVRGQGGSLSAFSEEQLAEAFALACSVAEPAAENMRSRATHAIRRLREQRLLIRVDGAGVLRAGEFALTRLAAGIIDFYLEEETLNQDTLGLLLGALEAALQQIHSDAQGLRTASAEDWRRAIEVPLQVTVKDLLASIERRQRGLDLKQESFQKQVTSLLEADWFGAVDQCQDLLDGTAATLRELNEMLLKHTHRLTELLEDTQELATAARRTETAVIAHQLADHLEQISAWGSSRQSAWSEYYDYVHRYLRDVVRLDPARAITQRLRDLLSSQSQRGYALTVASAAPIRLLRAVKPSADPPPVVRPKKPRETKLEEKPVKPDPMAELEQRVLAILQEGVSDLSELTRRLTCDVPEKERFVLAGRIAQVVARLRRPLSTLERPWVRINEQLTLEERGFEAADADATGDGF